MRVLILNGNPGFKDSGLDAYISDLQNSLKANGNETNEIRLRDHNIKNCFGCFCCWMKTPGECRSNDDQVDLLRQIMASDLILFASPVVMGFVTSLLKKTIDKMLPLVHPYATYRHNETHHCTRYEKRPNFALLLEKTADADAEDIEIISAIIQRASMSFTTNHAFTKTTEAGHQEVADAINTI
jgi:hypothetical protein